jgi:pilus assembly protein CpaC
MMHVGGEQQVMLEVKIAEVTRNLARSLRLDTASAAKTNQNDGSFFWSVAAAGAGLFTGTYVAGDTLFAWSLGFSRNTDLATVLAEPNLTTLSGKKASFLSGGEFPYTACNGTGGANNGGFSVPCTVSFKPFGVGLEFTPVVLDSNRINLTTHVTVSSLSNQANDLIAAGAAQACSTSGLFEGDTICTVNLQPTPSLDTREAVSTLEIADGQTLSIAGLLSENNTTSQEQTPGLADIPVLGSLFRNRDAQNEKKELLILVTPHLATPIPPEDIRLPTDNYVPPSDIDFYLLGRMEARKPAEQTAQSKVFDPANGGTSGQFGHQIKQ